MPRARLFRRIGAFALPAILVAFLATLSVLPSLAQDATPAAQASPVASPSATTETAEPVSVFASGNFRIAVVSAKRAPEIADVNLTARADKDWIVIIADVTNWSTKAATLRVRDFAIRVTGGAEPKGFASRSTQVAAEALSLEPTNVNGGVRIQRGDTTRMVLVFQIDSNSANPALFLDNQALPLASSFAAAISIAALPEVSNPAELQETKVEDALDGATLALADGTTVRLAALDTPEPAECFGGQSASRLKRLAGDTVLLEPILDGSAYVWKEQRGGTRLLLNYEMISDGFAALQLNTTGLFSSWLAGGDESARTSLAGLWGSCTAVHGVARTEGPERAVLNVRSGDTNSPYELWGIQYWAPELVTTPDGGAWAFFSANAKEGPEKDKIRLYGSYYDPSTGAWTNGTPMGTGDFQFGASAIVDARGLVHLVYTDQASGETGIYGVLMYTYEDGQGGWVDPVPVAPSDEAGHQIAPSLAIDPSGTLHVMWQDQRSFSAEARKLDAINADVFASDLPPGGEWTAPVEVNEHLPTAVGTWPNLVVDGDRLVAVWSVYTSVTGKTNAARIDWSSRPLDNPDGWTPPEALIYGRGDRFGGRNVKVAADPNGGVLMTFTRELNDAFLFVRRLPSESMTWSGDVLITAGDRGTFPSITVNREGDVYIVYNVGSVAVVDVGASAISYRSIQPGPERLMTQDDPNSQGLAVVTTDQTGSPWIIYFSQTGDSPANRVYVLRNAEIPTGS